MICENLEMLFSRGLFAPGNDFMLDHIGLTLN